MRNRSLASNRLFRMPTFLPKIDERKDRGGQEARTGSPADDAKQAAHRLHRSVIKMYPVSRHARQHSGRFSVVALLARLWRPF